MDRWRGWGNWDGGLGGEWDAGDGLQGGKLIFSAIEKACWKPKQPSSRF